MAVLGGTVVLVFAVLFFRLWVLQVLSADRYSTVAEASQVRTIDEPAERGLVLDREGRPLIENRPGNIVALDLSAYPTLARTCGVRSAGPPDARSARAVVRARNRAIARALPARLRAARRAAAVAASQRPSARLWRGCVARAAEAEEPDGARGARVLRRLSRLTATPIADVEDALHAAVIRSPFEPAPLARDVERALVFYVKEHATELPGVRIVRRSVRSYPQKDVAAQIVGGLTEISQRQLKDAEAYPDAQAGDVVGSGGVEQAFDRYLRGKDGELALRVGADGSPTGGIVVRREAQPGKNVRLTLDLQLQRVAERALVRGIERAQTAGFTAADAGAVVALDPRTGEILALASYPSFDPNRLAGSNGARYFRQIEDQVEAGDIQTPFIDRATSGLYPPGSTFKPVTAVAAVESGITSTDRPRSCPGRITIDRTRYANFESETEGDITLARALTVSCNTFFYQLGKLLYDATPNRKDGPQPQPEWARRFGFGRPSGLELPSASGVVPDIAYKLKKANGLARAGLYKKDSIPYQIDKTWNSGDAVLQAIGQGDTLATPLQVAVLYSAIANGGRLVTPHLGLRVESPEGGVLGSLAKEPRRTLDIDPYLLQTIRGGLFGVVNDVDGTAFKAFRGFGQTVAGKTGTAEKAGKRDYAWFAGYAPAETSTPPDIVVVAIVEQGGKGGEVAAPVVAEVLAKHFGLAVPEPPEVTSPVDQDEAARRAGLAADAAAADEAAAQDGGG